MDLTIGTIGIYLAINLVGLLWTAAIIQWGLPDQLRLQDRPKTWALLVDRIPLVAFNQVVLLALTAAALQMFGGLFTWQQPDLVSLLLQLLVILVLDDAWFYGWHRMLHENKWLYNRVHRIHHRAFSPIPIEYIYVHPLEWVVGSVGPFLGLVAINLGWGAIPVWTFWGYLLIRNLHELDIHSGMRSLLGEHIPLYGLAEHHDLHHAKPTMGNYASTFTYLDTLFGSLWRPETGAKT